MDTVQLLGSALGLGLLAGIRLYATVLILGLIARFHWFDLPSGLDVLGHTWVLATAGAACAIEFLADKIPWLDTMWDTVHTFIRPVGAALLGAAAFQEADPALKMVIALLCGGVAFGGHSSKAATRFAVNHSPEPFSNWALSLFEDAVVPVGIWIAVSHPLIAFVLVAIFLVIFFWMFRTIFRFFRKRFNAPATQAG
jgi:hypothetical protein